jgi:hypothetical protein
MNETMSKETIVPYFEAVPRDLPGGTTENHENPVRIAELRPRIESGIS